MHGHRNSQTCHRLRSHTEANLLVAPLVGGVRAQVDLVASGRYESNEYCAV
jgi:hypothetical protein